MATLTEMKMTGFKSNDPKDYEAVKQAIDEYLEEALDPETYAVRKMFEKIKKPTYTWDDDDVIIPPGGGMKPHPWDNDPWDK